MNIQETPSIVVSHQRRLVNRPAVISIIFVNIVLFVAAIAAVLTSGSIQGAVSYWLKGETLSVDASEKSLGIVAPGETAHISFTVTNRGKVSSRILGCETFCTCVVPNELPITLNAQENWVFPVTVNVPPQSVMDQRNTTHLELPLTLFTNSPVQSRILLVIKAEVRGKQSSEPTPRS